MIIAGAETASASFPSFFQGLAVSNPAGPVGSTKGTDLIDVFFSLFAGCAAEMIPDEGVVPPDSGARLSNFYGNPSANLKQNRKEQRKDAPGVAFASVPISRTDSPLPFAFGVALIPPGVNPPANPGAFTEMPGVERSGAAPVSADMAKQMLDAEPVPVPAPQFTNDADPAAPLAFALRLEEVASSKTLPEGGRIAGDAATDLGCQPVQESARSSYLGAAPVPVAAAALAQNSLAGDPHPSGEQNTNENPERSRNQIPSKNNSDNLLKQREFMADRRNAILDCPAQPATVPDDFRKAPQIPLAAVSEDDAANAPSPVGRARMPLVMAPQVHVQPDVRVDTTPRAVNRLESDSAPPRMAESPEIGSIVRPAPAREISMRLNSVEAPSVDIKLVDKAGAVHVAVRTPDADLTRNLQSGLNDLVQRLEHKGFETEVWSPGHTTGPRLAARVEVSSNDLDSQQGGSARRDSEQRGNSGHRGDGRNHPKWVKELEQRIDMIHRG